MRIKKTRRDFIWQTGGGFAGVALLDLLTRDGVVSASSILAPTKPHFAAKAKRAVFLFMNGAPSQCRVIDNEHADWTEDAAHGRRYTPWLTASSPCAKPPRLSE